MKKLKYFFRSTWSKFIVKQYTKVDNEFKDQTTTNEFRKLQIDSLHLETSIGKYKNKRNGGAMLGTFYRIDTHFKNYVDNNSVVQTKIVNAHNSKTVIETYSPSILN